MPGLATLPAVVAAAGMAALCTFLLLRSTGHGRAGVPDRRATAIAVATASAGGGAAAITASAHPYPGLVLVVLVGAAIAASVDAVTLVIPGALTAALGVTALLGWLVSGAPVLPLAAALIVAVAFVVAFAVSSIGGGDVKLLPSLVLAVASGAADAATAVLAVSAFLTVSFLVTAAALLLAPRSVSGPTGAAAASRQAAAPGFLLGALLVTGMCSNL